MKKCDYCGENEVNEEERDVCKECVEWALEVGGKK